LPTTDSSTGEPSGPPLRDMKSYDLFLRMILDNGYACCFFPEINRPEGQVALRHDVDFDTHLALKIARTENAMGVRSTYFFLMRSPFYNLLSAADFSNVLQIRDLGHRISIHFDPTPYKNIHEGLQWEARTFQALFHVPVEIVSLHRPSAVFQEFDAPIGGIEHTYQSKYFRDIKYFADSTGVWRYGHPFDSPEFAANKTLHILIHPIWWAQQGDDNLEKLRDHFAMRIEKLKQDFSDNCIPFRKIHEEL
jgi:hypothetical protein